MQKKYGIAFLVGALALAALFFYRFSARHSVPQTALETKVPPIVIAPPKPPEDPCLKPNYVTEQFEMKDGSMKGLIEAGSKYSVVKGWYRCNPVESGDIVFYRYNTNFPPVPRLVHGIPGDKFKLVKDKKRKAWNISVNHRVVTNHDGKEPHYFGSDAVAPVLSLYEKSMKGVLARSTYLVFATVSPGSYDSEMGVVNSDDFMGRIEYSNKVDTQPE